MPSLLPLPLASSDPGTERIAELKTLFPEAFADGKINFERLRLALGDAVDTGRERYGLSWAGKADAIRAIQIPSAGTLTPDREQSVNFDTTENLIIEGDNLEVLKLLQKSYYGKVKMIYIDPPYNTGNEFIYPDNFREGLQDYLRYSGQVQDDGTLASSTVDKDGRVHSRWLSMMYPRLFLAKNLLRDDGVIFVSIDDHEVHSLRLIMNEVLGEENFLGCISRTTKRGGNAGLHFSPSVDYILCFARKATQTAAFRLPSKPHIVASYDEEDEKSKYKWRGWYDSSLDLERSRNTRYPIVAPDGTSIYPPEGKRWRNAEPSFLTRLGENEIEFRQKNGQMIDDKGNSVNWVIFYKLRLTEEAGSVPDNIIDDSLNSLGSIALNELDIDFNFSKPPQLIKTLISICGNESDGDIILDFFAGSGTTAQSVLELNKEYGGNRKFIIVQLPEKTNNKQFPTIADITRERVRRVIDKINAGDADKLSIDEDAPDRGFKAFRLTSSNFKVWDGEAVQTDASELAVQLEAFASNVLPSATPDAMLYEIMLRAGLEIGASRETLTMGGQTVENIGNGALLVCLEPDIHLSTLRAMIAARPRFVVCLDTALHGDDALLTNAELEAKAAGKDNVTFYTV